MVVATRASSAWERYAWVGILYVIALVAETVVGLLGGSVSQNDSAAKIANVLYDHRERLLVITYLSVVYAAMFLIYLGRLYDLLRGNTDRSRFLGSLVLAGGALFIALHAVSDIGINGLLGAKLASFGFQHDQGVSYTLYLMTYGLDSVGDVFGSLFAFAAGVLVIEHGVLPRWLGWVLILAGILFFLQGFGLGGVIASFGLVLDLIGFVLFLIFVLVSSVILLDAPKRAPRHRGRNQVDNYIFEARWCGDRDPGHPSQRTASAASADKLPHVNPDQQYAAEAERSRVPRPRLTSSLVPASMTSWRTSLRYRLRQPVTRGAAVDYPGGLAQSYVSNSRRRCSCPHGICTG